MSTMTVTFCDRCNRMQDMDKSRAGRGYIYYLPTVAVKDFGWKYKRGQGIVCQQCQEDEERK